MQWPISLSGHFTPGKKLRYLLQVNTVQTPGPVSTCLEIRKLRPTGIQTTVRLDRTLFASRYNNNATPAPKDMGLLHKQ